MFLLLYDISLACCQISAETCYSLAIKNEFAALPEDVSVDSIIELISKIDDFSVAINAAKWAVKQLKLPKDGKIVTKVQYYHM